MVESVDERFWYKSIRIPMETYADDEFISRVLNYNHSYWEAWAIREFPKQKYVIVEMRQRRT